MKLSFSNLSETSHGQKITGLLIHLIDGTKELKIDFVLHGLASFWQHSSSTSPLNAPPSELRMPFDRGSRRWRFSCMSDAFRLSVPVNPEDQAAIEMKPAYKAKLAWQSSK